MAGRDDLAYDEDDYLPPCYVPPKRAATRTRSFLAMAVVGVLVGAVVMVFVTRSQRRAAIVRDEQARAGQNAVLAANQMATDRQMDGTAVGPAGKPNRNLNKLIGQWERAPFPRSTGPYPIRFHFRDDGTATITLLSADDQLVRREVRVTVFTEEADRITLQAHGTMAVPLFDHQYYRFTIKPDGTIVLDDTGDGLVFERKDAATQPR